MTHPAHLRTLLRALVLSALCIGTSGGHALAQNGSVGTAHRTAVVWGTILGAADARPLAGVAVALVETGGRARYSTQTDSAGRYGISAPTGTHYRLVARHPGYQPDSVGFRLGESTKLSLELEAHTIGIAPLAAEAQERGGIAGRVIDAATNLPVPEVAVRVEGTVYTGRTDAQGQYRIPEVPAGRVQLRTGRVGYDGRNQAVTVIAGQTITANFSLSASALGLGELVVTATGREERKREIGNVVTKIETEQVEMAPITNLSNLLQGRAPGVAVLPSSGTLGTGNRIQIRGASSISLVGTPLIIIDGIRTNNDVEASLLFTGGQSASRVEDINPEDIESIEILKGPAASALYGTAAANGVIQITTKRGRRGTSQLRAFAQRTTSETLRSQVPSNFLARGLNAQGQRVNCSFVERAAGTCVGLPDSIYEYNPLFQAPNSPLRTGYVNKYGASISGGSSDGAIAYYVSGEADEGTGTLRFNEIDRANFRANVSSRLSEKFRLSASTGFISNFIQLPQGDNSSGGVFLNALRGSPTPTNIQAFSGFAPPHNPSNVSAWGNEQDLRRFIGSANAEYRPLSWLSFNAVAGVDQSNRFERSFVDAGGTPQGSRPMGLREEYRLQQSEFTADLNGNMVHEFGRVTSTTSGGVRYNESVFDETYAAGTNITPGTKAATEPLGAPQEGAGGNKLFGILLSQQFGFADRFFVTGAIRGDQSSAFGENIGLITYPAVSASWVLLEEPWFLEVDVLSHLRLRAAYGESGRPPGRLEAIRAFTDRAAAAEGGIVPGDVTSRLDNVNLKAEITSETEFGADVGLFDNRLALEVTRFSKNTEDALVRLPLPPSLGGPVSQYANLGEVENKGWESSVRLEAIRTERFDLNLRFNFSTTQNKLVSLGDTT
ncbi:MAG: SusC/RagA family TonB-linked outer membrane protein, partial [Gemmatimonadetes bacterium]|nr:SusC/RagA family TonB-linked outer membrane protein [Gemmatimonadota bacterium]